ncbi:MAG: hypothetical protein KKE53_19710 [Proteobacteria bacterium]|nr:hypothetical protein [Pseudomonadota bacterium]
MLALGADETVRQYFPGRGSRKASVTAGIAIGFRNSWKSMQHLFDVTLSLISQFTGGQGGIEHGIVQFGIAGMFWFNLMLFAWYRQRQSQVLHEKVLLAGFGLGFLRELFMLTMASLQAYGIVNGDDLHIIFPPLEHAIFDIAILVIAAGYMEYLLEDKILAQRYLKIGIALVLLCYCVTFIWWGKHIVASPDSKFGQTWCDWIFRINASVLLVFPIVTLIKKTRGWVRTAISVALSLFFLNEFLKIPDMMLGEVYETIFAPIRHGLYIIGVYIFAYIYLRELYEEREIAAIKLQVANDTLEEKVKKRTADLEAKLIQIKVLNGLLPICASCKKIRDDKGYWTQIEAYITKHSEAQFSHGICEECADRLYGDQDWYEKQEKAV